MKSVAFLGAGGLMGSRMAKRLIDHGFELSVYNRTAARIKPLIEAGARSAAGAAEAVRAAEAVVVMVSDGPSVEAVLLGEAGAVAAARPGTLFIDSSTVLPATSQLVAEAAVARGCAFLDAPVFGSKEQAEGGILQFIVGGASADFERAGPLFAAMGNSAKLIGPTGAGSTLKLANNVMGAIFTTAMAEAASVLKKAGVDEAVCTEMLAGGAMGSRMFTTKWPKMMSGDFTTQFALELLHKDVRYFLALANEHGCQTPTAALVAQLLQGARNAGLGGSDMSSIYTYLTGVHAQA